MSSFIVLILIALFSLQFNFAFGDIKEYIKCIEHLQVYCKYENIQNDMTDVDHCVKGIIMKYHNKIHSPVGMLSPIVFCTTKGRFTPILAAFFQINGAMENCLLLVDVLERAFFHSSASLIEKTLKHGNSIAEYYLLYIASNIVMNKESMDRGNPLSLFDQFIPQQLRQLAPGNSSNARSSLVSNGLLNFFSFQFKQQKVL